jgi:hypothetical protein
MLTVQVALVLEPLYKDDHSNFLDPLEVTVLYHASVSEQETKQGVEGRSAEDTTSHRTLKSQLYSLINSRGTINSRSGPQTGGADDEDPGKGWQN